MRLLINECTITEWKVYLEGKSEPVTIEADRTEVTETAMVFYRDEVSVGLILLKAIIGIEKRVVEAKKGEPSREQATTR